MLLSLWHAFLTWVHQAGYPGMTVAMLIEGLGIPFPGDAVLAFYGYMISQAHFSYPQAILWSSFGCWLGSLVSFAIGRTYGVGFLQRFGRLLLLQPKHVRYTETLSDRYGIWVVLVGRFFPGVRTLSSYFAGIGGMTWSTFIGASLLGFVLWCSAWLGIGLWFGSYSSLILAKINQFLLYFILAAAAGIGVWYWIRRKTA